MRFAAGFLLALLVAPPRVETVTEYEVIYEVIVVREPALKQEPADTPTIDSLMTDEDWERIDRESDCLFDYLQLHVGWDITLDAVLAAGYWTDVLGGPCTVMADLAGALISEGAGGLVTPREEADFLTEECS